MKCEDEKYQYTQKSVRMRRPNKISMNFKKRKLQNVFEITNELRFPQEATNSRKKYPN